MLQLSKVQFGYPSHPVFADAVDLEVGDGECWAIVGPNGAGKSTLLRLMAGLVRPQAGRVVLQGRTISHVSLRDRARMLAFLPQQPPVDLDLSARELVLMGRFPHRTLGLFESATDHEIAEEAMRITGTLEFADRLLMTLSGGEIQRVHLAAAFAQRPAVLLLDEPTASLDIRHQLAIFDILARRVARKALSVVVATHDLNLAARFCSHVVLLDGGKVVAIGEANDVLTPKNLSRVYGVRVESVPVPESGGRHWLVPLETMVGSPR